MDMDLCTEDTDMKDATEGTFWESVSSVTQILSMSIREATIILTEYNHTVRVIHRDDLSHEQN